MISEIIAASPKAITGHDIEKSSMSKDAAEPSPRSHRRPLAAAGAIARRPQRPGGATKARPLGDRDCGEEAVMGSPVKIWTEISTDGQVLVPGYLSSPGGA
ncbi:MAG TPA: hypothetical protein VMA73_10105 [Streptosporangiaceae bacterium]|nr:hypothetical protein [Streptosporangiaceae bacterium]